MSSTSANGQPLLEAGFGNNTGDADDTKWAADDLLRQKDVQGSPRGRGAGGAKSNEKWSRCKGGCMWCFAVAAVIFTGLSLFLPIFAGNMFIEQLAESIAFDSPDAQGYAGFVRGPARVHA